MMVEVGAAEAWAQNALIFSDAFGDIHAAIANGLGPVVDLNPDVERVPRGVEP